MSLEVRYPDVDMRGIHRPDPITDSVPSRIQAGASVFQTPRVALCSTDRQAALGSDMSRVRADSTPTRAARTPRRAKRSRKMTKRLASTLTLAAALAVAAVAVPAAAASADVSQTPVATDCPSGYQRLSLDFLASQGPYRVPFLIDAGHNNNGFVCGLAVPEAARLALCGPDCPVPVLYLFTEDDSPAQGKAQVGG
jgi:hypothetical protein